MLLVSALNGDFENSAFLCRYLRFSVGIGKLKDA
jgi:hypothetical protein